MSDTDKQGERYQAATSRWLAVLFALDGTEDALRVEREAYDAMNEAHRAWNASRKLAPVPVEQGETDGD